MKLNTYEINHQGNTVKVDKKLIKFAMLSELVAETEIKEIDNEPKKSQHEITEMLKRQRH